jgi:hypothetical protein
MIAMNMVYGLKGGLIGIWWDEYCMIPRSRTRDGIKVGISAASYFGQLGSYPFLPNHSFPLFKLKISQVPTKPETTLFFRSQQVLATPVARHQRTAAVQANGRMMLRDYENSQASSLRTTLAAWLLISWRPHEADDDDELTTALLTPTTLPLPNRHALPKH